MTERPRERKREREKERDCISEKEKEEKEIYQTRQSRRGDDDEFPLRDPL